RARHRCLLRVGVDAPGALGDLRDAEGDELLGLGRDGAVLEGLLVELEKCPVGFRDELPHLLELSPSVDAVKLHARPPRDRPTSGRRIPWRRPPGSGAWSRRTAPADRR